MIASARGEESSGTSQPGLLSGRPPASAGAAPVLIVGAGACGLVAALMLHDQGIEAVVLERDALPSGSTALSSGFIPAPGTRAQRARGIEDSAALFAQDIQAKAHGQAAPHLVQAYAEAIGPALDALALRHGLVWEVLDGFLYPGHSALRMHAVPERTGAGLMGRLLRAVEAAGITVMTQARVSHLWHEPFSVDTAAAGRGVQADGGAATPRITGVRLQRPDGLHEDLSCDALLLACNGFGGNRAMVEQLLPEMRAAAFGGHAGNDGSAIAWGQQLGAALADLGAYQGHGSWAVPQGALISWALMMEGGVQINARGERFHDETQGYSEAAVQVLAQPGGVAWNVIDGPLLQLARGFPDFVEAEKAGACRAAADVAELAQVIGCNGDVLHHTLAGIDAQVLAPDGRRFRRALRAPFMAIKVTGALFHTQGGLDIDAQCRVRDAQARPFANLWAAGGAARGVSGTAVWGYLSGNGLLSAVAGAALAAASIARKIQAEPKQKGHSA